MKPVTGPNPMSIHGEGRKTGAMAVPDGRSEGFPAGVEPKIAALEAELTAEFGGRFTGAWDDGDEQAMSVMVSATVGRMKLPKSEKQELERSMMGYLGF